MLFLMQKPLLSIIIPTYNAGKTIEQCLESIDVQKFKNYEVIIVDGISSDNTLETVRLYANKDINLTLITERDNGIYDAMNKGIKMAAGEWVYFLGSDDTFFDSTVLTDVFATISKDADIVYGNSIWMPEKIEEKGEWDYYRLLNMSINHQRIFYRACLFEKLGNFNLLYTIAADYELNIRFFCAKDIKTKFINRTIANYHSGGFSADKIDEAFWNDWQLILIKNFSPHLPKQMIYNRLSWYCWDSLKQKKYAKFFRLFSTIFGNTLSFTFLKHTLSHCGHTDTINML